MNVSIPLWDDWKRYDPDAVTFANGVSIPLWDDWKSRGLRLYLLAQIVSIPLWDDWKASVEGANCYTLSFNSTMG